MRKTTPPPTAVQVTERVRPIVEEDERIRFLYLFGSAAKGDTHAQSDLDLAAFVDPLGTLVDDARLHDALSKALDRDDVDLVVLNQAPLWLQFRILGEGVLVFSRDERCRIAFRERVEKQFLDFRPYHERYLAAVRERARKGTLTRG